MLDKVKGKFQNFKDKKKNNVSEDTQTQFMQDEMQHARTGVLYVFSHTKVDGVFGTLFLTSTLSSAGSLMTGAGQATDNAGLKWAGFGTGLGVMALGPVGAMVEKENGKPFAFPKDKPELKTTWDKIKAKLAETAKWLWDTFMEGVVAPMSNWGALIKGVISYLTRTLVSEIAPMGGITDLASGIGRIIDSTIQRTKAWVRTRSVAFVKGHPTAIIDAMKTAMDRAIGKGLYTSIKGAVQIGADAALFGAGSLVKAMATAMELLVQVINRICEIETVKAFCGEAKRHWDGRKTSGFTRDPVAFGIWMKKYCNKVPALAATAMNCGYCGSPMQYIAMYNDKHAQISSHEYMAGVKALAELKDYGARYLRACGLNFYSEDAVVNGALKAARNYNKIRHIAQNRTNDVVRGLLT
ncbi:MAG: hypothetical protein AAF677_09470 [Pseudomonadota bacterium]